MLMILSVGEARPRPSCRVMSDSRHETPAQCSHLHSANTGASESQLFELLKLNVLCCVVSPP